MAPQETSPPQGTRERILEVALELFSETGYDKTSLRNVAERVGVTKAALYYHFPSKESLLMALIERAHSVEGHGLDLLPSRATLANPADLARFAMKGIDTVMAQRPLFVLMERNRAAIGSLHSDDPVHQEVHHQMEERWTAYFQDQDLPLRLRVRLAASLGAVMACAVGSLRGLGDDGDLRSELASAVMDLLEIAEADRPNLDEAVAPSP